MTLASRIAVMHQGSVQQFDEPQTIYDRPANMFVAGFMGSPAMNFIPAELASQDGKAAVRIKLANGTQATLPLHRNGAIAAPGKEVVLGVRPEHMFRHDPDLRARKPCIATLSAPVELVEPTGAETMAVLKFGDLEVVGRFDPDGAPRMGETITLGIDMAHACLFDPATRTLI